MRTLSVRPRSKALPERWAVTNEYTGERERAPQQIPAHCPSNDRPSRSKGQEFAGAAWCHTVTHLPFLDWGKALGVTMTAPLVNYTVCYEKNITMINSRTQITRSLLSPLSESPSTQRHRLDFAILLTWAVYSEGRNQTYSHSWFYYF